MKVCHPHGTELGIGATSIHRAFIRGAELLEGIHIRLEQSWHSFMGEEATEVDLGCSLWVSVTLY